MRHLMVMRHAKSAWDDPALSDHDRPLNDRGREAAEVMGAFIQEQERLPQLVLRSTATRVEETYQLMSRNWAEQPRVIVLQSLYLATVSTILQVVRRNAEQETRLLVLGHNPGLHELVERAVGPIEKFPTAALAELSYDIPTWQELKADQAPASWHLTKPKDLIL